MLRFGEAARRRRWIGEGTAAEPREAREGGRYLGPALSAPGTP